jgi:RNA polymerase sigma-70 factor (ECF subfamily)
MPEPPAFAEIYESTLPAVWRFVRSRVAERDQAEDLTSEVYVRALAAWDRFDATRGSPTAWLCGIAAHAIQEWRRRKRWISLTSSIEVVEGDRARGEDPEPERQLVRAEETARLGAALATLSERERDALALRFAAGLQAGEVGLILGLSPGATKMLLFRAIRRLREAIDVAPARTDAEHADAMALDEMVDRVLARGTVTLPEPLAERLVRQLAMIYSHPVPPGLAERVDSALACPVTRMMTRPGRPFLVTAGLLAGASLAAAGWRWQAALPGSADLTELVLLALAAAVVLAGLALLVRRPTLGSGTIGLGALIFAFCLWWTGIGLLVGVVMAGAALRQVAWSPRRAAG